MRHFATAAPKARGFAFETKLLYSFFMLASLAGLVVAGLFASALGVTSTAGADRIRPSTSPKLSTARRSEWRPR